MSEEWKSLMRQLLMPAPWWIAIDCLVLSIGEPVVERGCAGVALRSYPAGRNRSPCMPPSIARDVPDVEPD
ncbi:hypothetical protein, partial [Arthrobacter sp. Hiyo1]|uniref:hypothetical protein n=1 Tax=Arthrobacter sp. Hiyo1 TaxID=1588020 RepID=UPI000A8374C2